MANMETVKIPARTCLGSTAILLRRKGGMTGEEDTDARVFSGLKAPHWESQAGKKLLLGRGQSDSSQNQWIPPGRKAKKPTKEESELKWHLNVSRAEATTAVAGVGVCRHLNTSMALTSRVEVDFSVNLGVRS